MASDNVLTRAFGILAGRGREGGGLQAADLASLQVALMVAALDGKVLPEEFRSFERLAKRCEGATEETVAKAFDAALRSAGYVLMQSFRLSERPLKNLFADEAEKLLPKDFLTARQRTVRAAFLMWLSMAMSDGDYSGIERACIETLFQRLHAKVFENFLAVVVGSAARSRVHLSERDLRRAARDRAEAFLPIDFLSRTETILAAYARTSDAAEDELRDLVG